MSDLLEVEDLRAAYGTYDVLHGLSFSVAAGGVTTLLGANGAGKTTALRCVCGQMRSRGAIRFDGASIAGRAAEDIVRLGIAHVPENRGTFAAMTVEENLRLGAYTRRDRAAVARDFEVIYADFPRLKERRRQLAGTLSGGEQQLLAIARALMLRPRLLVLDEPSFGLAPLVVGEIFRLIGEINRGAAVGILLVEQNARLALDLADRACLIETGRIVRSGAAGRIRGDEAVRRSYLGT
ncbi:MAG TPA: ABC transporter ATP-binding protein [Burkholderiaceae bacterium]